VYATVSDCKRLCKRRGLKTGEASGFFIRYYGGEAAGAKKAGKQIRRKRVLNDAQVEEIKCRIATGEVKKKGAMEFGISRQTLYTAIAAMLRQIAKELNTRGFNNEKE